MADLISRAAARDIIVDMRGLCRNDVLCDAMKKINAISSVDAVPVVRCRDCRYWRQEVTSTEHWVCAHHSNNERRVHTMPDFYCAAGDRGGMTMNKLIDAEALKESVRKKFTAIPDRCEVNELVNAAPTIDAIPVEWLREKMKTPTMTCANPFDYVFCEWMNRRIEHE